MVRERLRADPGNGCGKNGGGREIGERRGCYATFRDQNLLFARLNAFQAWTNS
jgi:hypothetical protein